MKGREYETAGRVRGRRLVRILDCSNNNCKLTSERVVKTFFPTNNFFISRSKPDGSANIIYKEHFGKRCSV